MRLGENLASSGVRETLEKPEDWRKESHGRGVEGWGSEASRPGVASTRGDLQGSCTCQTTMPPTCVPRTWGWGQGGVWLVQTPQSELS